VLFLRKGSCLFFWDVAERGLRVFFYLLAVLSLFRVLFLCGMTDYLQPQTGLQDIVPALWLGLRLSMQTAGLLALPVWLIGELSGLCSEKMRFWSYRIMGGTELALLAIAFVGRFPYYRQFHTGYNQALFNTVHDDMWALLVSLVQEFNLPLRLAGALLLAALLCRGLQSWLGRDMLFSRWLQQAARPAQLLLSAVGSGILYLVVAWTMYGGSLGWQTALEWENVGVTGDRLLNEAILDDVQAIYRGYTLQHRNLACNGLEFSAEEIQRLTARLAANSGRPGLTGNDLDVYLTRQARGNKIKPPSQIFLIVSESLANWPLLEEYQALHIADGLRSLKSSSETAYTGAMLPNGAFTVSAVMGLVTGFADANLYLTTMPEAFAAPYPTAAAPILRRLGYTPHFWYAGPTSWERVQDFALAQGFASFAGRGSFKNAEGNVWGLEDEHFYRGVLAQLEDSERGFHLLLNVSNHSPYSLDLARAGFPKEKVRAALPEQEQNNEELLRQLGHYWYADKQLTWFVRELQSRYPDCLIAIVGDHADRYNVEKNPSEYKRLAVPFLLLGQGIKKDMLPPEAAGSQIDILPTIVELIAPEGFSYEALGSSLDRNRRGVNYGYWITADTISQADVPFAPQDFQGNVAAMPQAAEGMEDYINAIWAISWWRAKHGAELK